MAARSAPNVVSEGKGRDIKIPNSKKNRVGNRIGKIGKSEYYLFCSSRIPINLTATATCL